MPRMGCKMVGGRKDKAESVKPNAADGGMDCEMIKTEKLKDNAVLYYTTLPFSFSIFALSFMLYALCSYCCPSTTTFAR